MGVPAIASNIAAFREVGGAAPDFLHPLDGPGWRRAVEDFSPPDSTRRAAQLLRARDWAAPCWDRHFAVASKLLERFAALRDVAAPTRGVA